MPYLTSETQAAFHGAGKRKAPRDRHTLRMVEGAYCHGADVNKSIDMGLLTHKNISLCKDKFF